MKKVRLLTRPELLTLRKVGWGITLLFPLACFLLAIDTWISVPLFTTFEEISVFIVLPTGALGTFILGFSMIRYTNKRL
ncbi:hypothetical protein IH781_00270 [Patescibacteria group bacterium]|nr:hypothetical protein [Patescibacteria group bacterium]